MWNNKSKILTPKLQDVIDPTNPRQSDAESRELEQLLADYGEIFSTKSDGYSRTDRAYYLIDMGEG
jgi:hypothetical protein